MPDSKDFPKQFASRLKEAMEARRITARELSKSTGISDPNISRYLKGAYAPKRNNIYLIAKSLRVNPLWLLGFSNDMEVQAYQADSEKNALLAFIDDMDSEQIHKTLNFVSEYILK